MNIAYFRNGELYDVSPRNNFDNIFEDREVAYKADIVVSDNIQYDLFNQNDIKSIQIPQFTADIPAVLELSYIMKIRCRIVDNALIIPMFVEKTVDLMLASKMIWREQDYMQVIRNFHRMGLIQEGTKFEAKFKQLHSDIERNLKTNAQIAALNMLDDYYDAVEITAHNCCSPDHEAVQGRIFLKAEYEKMQSGKEFQDVNGNNYAPLMRPIGIGECRHFVRSCNSDSNPIYSVDMLAEMYTLNHTTYVVNGKEYARYEIYTIMKNIEDQTRREKQKAVAAMDKGDMETRIICQRCINALAKDYYEFAYAADLKSSLYNTSVAGFREVKFI